MVWMQRNVAPDILLDRTSGALRGVEVAGRGGGGFAALRFAIERCGCLVDGLDPFEASRAWG